MQISYNIAYKLQYMSNHANVLFIFSGFNCLGYNLLKQ